MSDYERKHVKQIIIPEGCKSVEGIQYFSECEVEHQHIRLYSTDLTTLDLSGMQMSDFYAEGMRLESLNLQGCEKLEVLFCQQNRLTTLNLQGCTSLRSIKCYDNRLTSLNLGRATALKYLHCHNNQIEILSITSPSIQTINCSYNPLTALFLPTITYNATTLLTELDCRHTQLTTLDLGDNRYNRVECSSSPINGITWSSAGNGSVKQLYCDSTKVSGEDLSAIPHPEELSYLSCRNCGISSIDVSRMTSLAWLLCSRNKLTTLDLSHNAALHTVDIFGNQLHALDVTSTRISSLLTSDQYIEGQAVDIDGGLYVRLNSEVVVDSIFNLWYHNKKGEYRISEPFMRGEYLLINMDGIDFDKVHYSYHAGNGTTLRVNINTGAKGVGINEYNFPDERFRRYLLSQSYGRDSLLTDDEIAAITKLDISGKSIVSLEGIHYLNNLSDLNCSSNNLTSDGFQPVVWLANLTHLEFSQNAGITSFDASRLTKLRWLVGWECGLSSLNLTGCNDIENLTRYDQGRISYDEMTNTLTLDSAYIGSTAAYAIRDSIPGLTIKLNGESTFNMSKGEGLDAYCDVTITGPGKVTFKTDNNAIYLSWNDNTLTVKGGAEVIADASEATSSDSYGISGFTRDGLIGVSEAACVGTLNVEGNGTVVKAIGKKVSIGQLKALTYPAGASLLVGSQDGTNTTQGYFVNNNVCISSGTGRVDRIYLPAKNLWVTLTCPTYVRGDVNMDGTVDAADLTALAGIIVGTAADTEMADVNEDGSVTVADLTALVGMLVSGN